MPLPLVLDTCVLVDFLRGHPAAVSFLLSNQDRSLLSPVVIAELHRGARNDEEISELDRLPVLFNTVSISPEIGRQSGAYMREYAASHGLRFADAVIAATTTSESAALATLNVRHFPMFAGLEPPYDA